MGTDVVIGTSQRFGIPMGYGGLMFYFITHEKYKRNIPGRIIGVTKDVDGNRAFENGLTNKRTNTKREKITSNICIHRFC